MWGLGQHTLLGIVVGLCASATPYWVLMLVYVGPRARHFTGYCCWFMWGLGQHTLLGIVVNVFMLLVSQLTSTNVPQSDKSHIHKLAPSPKPSGGRVYASICIQTVNVNNID
jgi:hypothetical protein